MKRYIFIISALFAAGTVAAQDGINKQLEVTKAYTPKVGQAAKLPVEPRMIDTVQLRPEIEYSITPTAWRTAFGSDKYSPAVMSVVPFEKNRPLYLRAGLGYPLQSTADLYYNPYVGPQSTFGLFFNHRGSYSRIENDLGMKPNSTEMLNALGLYGSRYYRRYKLEGDLWYDNRIYDMYGSADPASGAYDEPYYFQGNRIDMGRLQGNIRFGDTFTDLSRLNFQFMFRPGVTHMDGDIYQVDFDAGARLGKVFNGKHGFEAGVYQRGFLNDETDYEMALAFHPQYLLALNKFDLRAGLDLLYIDTGYSFDRKNYVKVFPRLEMSYNVGNGVFVPFLTGGARILDASAEALSRLNPYSWGWTGHLGNAYDIRLGFSGNVGGVFSYNIKGGASLLQDYANLYPHAEVGGRSDGEPGSVFHAVEFRPEISDGIMYTAGAGLGLSLNGFKAGLEANWYKYDLYDLPEQTGLPPYDLKLDLSYSHRKFTASAGVKLIGATDIVNDGCEGCYVFSATTSVDLSLGFEYNVSKNFGVWIEGRNLANQKLYPYAYYRGLGANVMLGVKAVF